MSSSIDEFAKRAKRRANFKGDRHIELGRVIQKWQQWPDGPDAAPDEVRREGVKARNRMVEENSLLAVKAVFRWRHKMRRCGGRIDEQDMLSACLLGLTRAAERYDPERSTRFSTIAHWWLFQASGRLVQMNRAACTIPTARLMAVAKASTFADLATPMDRAAYFALCTISLDAPCAQNGCDLSEVIAA
jgi:DNA-directed RNA polymerase sigma subunit (sigma70/sigma32)